MQEVSAGFSVLRVEIKKSWAWREECERRGTKTVLFL